MSCTQAGRAALGCNFTFDTALGDLDLPGYLEPVGDYDALIGNAQVMDIGGIHVNIIALDDLIKIKQHIRRPKDRSLSYNGAGRCRSARGGLRLFQVADAEVDALGILQKGGEILRIVGSVGVRENDLRLHGLDGVGEILGGIVLITGKNAPQSASGLSLREHFRSRRRHRHAYPRK